MEHIDIIKFVVFLFDIVQPFDWAGFIGQLRTMTAQKHHMLDVRLMYRLDNIVTHFIVVISKILCLIIRGDHGKGRIGALKGIGQKFYI